MINLSNVTLVCVTSYKIEESITSLKHCAKFFNFADVKLITHENIKIPGITVEKCPKLDYKGYSEFIIYKLHEYINTDFVLIINWDGFILNPKQWDNKYLDYDYIGAPWNWIPQNNRPNICPVGKCVGNGGFSIRSKKLMTTASEYDYDGSQGDEDEFLCRVIGDDLNSKDINFAPT